ncbi:MAG: rhodanese-like domain-containing protein [Elusimicrobiota bacterium]
MTTTSQKYQTIDRASLKAKIDKKEIFQLWNVLNKDNYKPESNIAGSKWVPVDGITEKLASEKIPSKTETVITYCAGPQCQSSRQAAEKLASMGYTNVFAYEGGVKDWSESGMPVVTL